MKQPLREIRIQADLTFTGDKLIKTLEAIQPLSVSMNETFDWNPHYICSDELQENHLGLDLLYEATAEELI